MSRKSRKGLSTMIAAVFMMAIIGLGLNVILWSAQQQKSLGQSIVEKGGTAIERTKESLELRGIGIVSNKFNVTLYNTGSLPVHLVRMWVTNNTAGAGIWHNQYTLDCYVNPRETIINIGQSSICPSSSNPRPTALTGKTYTFGFVTERGTLATYKVAGGSDAQLNVRLVATPQSPQNSTKVSVLMLVRNNSTLADAVTNIVPAALTTNPVNACTTLTGPTPVSEPTLIKGSSTSFQWTCTIQGTVGQTVTFTGSISSGMSNQATASVNIISVSLDQTNFATIAGTLTIDYETIKRVQTGDPDWKPGFSMARNTPTVIKATLTNHHPTSTFWIGKNTAIILYPQQGSSNNQAFFVGINGAPGSPPTIGAYCSGPADYCTGIAPNGGTFILYVGACGPSGSSACSTPNLNPPGGQTGSLIQAPLLLFGKMCAPSDVNCPTSNGTQYGQNIPFMAIFLT